MPAPIHRLLPIAAAIAGAAVFHRYTLLTGFDAVQADNGDNRFAASRISYGSLPTIELWTD